MKNNRKLGQAVMHSRRIGDVICFGLATVCLSAAVGASADDTRRMANEHIQAVFARQDGAWRLTQLARLDGADALDMTSDEFEILLFDGQRFTVEAYRAAGDPDVSKKDGTQTFEVLYHRGAATSLAAPESVTVTYRLRAGPYLHKTVYLRMEQDGKVDRLQVLRFSTPQRATRGGEGQPVFIGNWFFGMDYPGFYSRHSDGFEEPDFKYRWHYTIDLEGRDIDAAPRDGLVTLFHFPGYAKQGGRAADRLGATAPATWTPPAGRSFFAEKTPESGSAARKADGSFGIMSKRAVIGISRKPGEGAELALMDYIAETRKPPRSNLHFNNWYSPEAKAITVNSFVNRVGRTIVEKLKEHGAQLDNMVPDNGWQRKKGFEYIYQPAVDENHDPLPKVSAALQAIGTRLGIWIALDVTLDLLAYERSLNPKIFQNYTNGSWFSPFWLQYVDTLWMMSGDSGGNGAWPALSLREGATAYRDAWFYQSFNNPERCVRPAALPIANFMTHGILYSSRKNFTDGNDTLRDWSDYCVMYFGRGTLLKELYITNELLDDDHWMVLGRAAAWAQHNQDRLINTALIGGDCSQGQAYGYVSWVRDRAILSVRNPDRRFQTLEVPFDASVYYRGSLNRSFEARAIYPYVEEMPWKLVSGRSFEVGIPGDTTVIYEIEPGIPMVDHAVTPDALSDFSAAVRGEAFSLRLRLPNDDMARCNLLVQPWGTAVSRLAINGESVEPDRRQVGKAWSLSAYDLRRFRSQQIAVKGQLVPTDETKLAKESSGNPRRFRLESQVIGIGRTLRP